MPACVRRADNSPKDSKMPRLFTGVEIPADVGQALGMLRGGLPGARWIDPENYHLTLRFIGEQAAKRFAYVQVFLDISRPLHQPCAESRN